MNFVKYVDFVITKSFHSCLSVFESFYGHVSWKYNKFVYVFNDTRVNAQNPYCFVPSVVLGIISFFVICLCPPSALFSFKPLFSL